MIIKGVRAEKILAADGSSTLKVTINNNYSASVPSTGKLSPSTIRFLNTSKKFIGIDINNFDELAKLEEFEEKLGKNGILALQYAALRAVADKDSVWYYLNKKARLMPTPLGAIIGGGKQTIKSSSDIQEFLLIPQGKTFQDNALANELVWRKVKKDYPRNPITDQGAFVLRKSSAEILSYLSDLISNLGLGFPVHLGVDIAASNLYRSGKYSYRCYSAKTQNKSMSKDGQVGFINHLVKEYDLKYVEDPLHLEDVCDYAKIQSKIVCGDDVTCTDINLLKKYKNHLSAVIIKPDQVGSVVKTKEVISYCDDNDIIPVMSHQLADTSDDMISHLSVAWCTPFIKCGIQGREMRAKIQTLQAIGRQIELY
ncbi:MAG: hypothetical protein AABW49_00485 [Nanoarchaeota archaeon]